jgi:isopentenyl diphosphate isomerase/L-lactate dehydrogenase-like FMN-dependent dehydrogenase
MEPIPNRVSRAFTYVADFLLDRGVQAGQDVLKALARGARASLIGNILR